MPAVLVLCAVAAYSDNNNTFDVWVMVGAGVLGYAMRHLGYDPAPLVLGLVLGPLLERSLLQALTIGRGDVARAMVVDSRGGHAGRGPGGLRGASRRGARGSPGAIGFRLSTMYLPALDPRPMETPTT